MCGVEAVTDLKPCPFCGSHRTVIIRPDDGFRAGCKACLASTGANACPLGAQEDWNRRHIDYFANLGKTLALVGMGNGLLRYAMMRANRGLDGDEVDALMESIFLNFECYLLPKLP